MTERVWTSLIATSVVVFVVVRSVSLSGQTATSRAASLPGAAAVKAFAAARTMKGFTPPKTPWGDPDISGVFTNKDEANTPLERPEEWAGRRMEDITAQELADAVTRRQEIALEQAPFVGGGEPQAGVAITKPIHWFDNLTSKNSRPWFVIEPADGNLPPLTAQAEARPRPAPRGLRDGEANTYLDRSLIDRCITTSVLRTAGIYGNSYQILQTPDYVVIRTEIVHEARMVPLDGRPHTNNIRQYQGDARGRWDGNTLVVESTNFHERARGLGSLNPLAVGSTPGRIVMKDSRIIERFTRIAPNTVEWSFTIDDPTTWTRPWTYSLPLTEDNTQPIFEYACHEGNFGLANILTGGRALDNAAGTTR